MAVGNVWNNNFRVLTLSNRRVGRDWGWGDQGWFANTTILLHIYIYILNLLYAAKFTYYTARISYDFVCITVRLFLSSFSLRFGCTRASTYNIIQWCAHVRLICIMYVHHYVTNILRFCCSCFMDKIAEAEAAAGRDRTEIETFYRENDSESQ